MERIHIRVPDGYVDCIDKFVNAGVYTSRSEAVREFIRNGIWWLTDHIDGVRPPRDMRHLEGGDD